MERKLSTVVEDKESVVLKHGSSRKSCAAKASHSRFLPDLVSHNATSSPTSRVSSPASSASGSVAGSVRSSKRKTKLPGFSNHLAAVKQELLECVRDESSDVGMIKILLKESQYRKVVNEKDDEFGWTPLHFVTNSGHTHLVKIFLDAKSDAHATCNLGNTPLHVATRCNHTQVVDLLVARGSSTNCQNEFGWAPLHCGAMNGHKHVIITLLSSSGDPEILDNEGRTACMWAARHGHASVVHTLLPKAPNFELRDFDGLSVMDHARMHRELRRAVRKLWASSRDLLEAARQDRLDEVMDALENGPALNARDSQGGSAIGWASTNGNVEMVRLLLQHGADPHLVHWRPDPELGCIGSVDGVTLSEAIKEVICNASRLVHGAQDNDWPTAIEALKQGAWVNGRDKFNQRTALIWAAVHGEPSAIHQLVQARSDIEARDSVGWTAVHCAVHYGKAEALCALHENHADFAARTWEGDFAQHLAAKSGDWQMLHLLKAAKTNMEALNAEQLTCLQVAVIADRQSAISTLLALGSNYEVRDCHGRTIFHLAVVHGHLEIARMLLDPLRPPKSEASGRLENVTRSQLSHHEDAEQGRQSPVGIQDKMHHGHVKKSRQSKLKRRVHQSHDKRQHDDGGDHGEIDQHTHQHSGEIEQTSCEKPASRSPSLEPASAEKEMDASSEQLMDVPALAIHGDNINSRGSAVGGVPSARSVASISSHRGTAVGGIPSARSATSISSHRGKKNRCKAHKETKVTENNASLTMISNANRKQWPSTFPPAFAARNAFGAVDAEGHGALALALRFKHSLLVALLVDLSADVNAADQQGTTMLMLAADWGERSVVDNLLVARAQVAAADLDGKQAIHYAKNGLVLRELESHLERSLVELRLASTQASASPKPSVKLAKAKAQSRSAPSLHSSKAAINDSLDKCRIYRVRLESLPVRLPADMLENHIRTMLRRRGNFNPMRMSVAVDPITQRPRGYAYLDFSDPRAVDQLVRDGGEILFGNDTAGVLYASAIKVARESMHVLTEDGN